MTRSLCLLAASLLLGACNFGLSPSGKPSVDLDGDGVPAESDCDDNEVSVYPEAEERCDGLDNNCDGTVDNDALDAMNAWADLDADGYGDQAAPLFTCAYAAGIVPDHTDCDDAAPAVNPGAAEVCNDADDNCNGVIDTDSPDWGTWYSDSDADGFGATDQRADGCLGGALSRYSGDCDDTDARYNPGASETDCLGTEDFNCDGSVGRIDADGDGFAACEECDDGRGAVHPGSAELCDALDNDCDGSIDVGAADEGTWYLDKDSDDYGLSTEISTACDRPAGYAAQDGDCDDDSPLYNPGAEELDCADPNDYNCDGSVGTEDLDADGFSACEDCNDLYANIRPGALELCNGYDDDCDGAADESGADGETAWYADADADGFGDIDDRRQSCEKPVGYTVDNTDCDDTDEDVSPAAAERCNGYDDDCDGVVDPDTAAGATTVYRDADRDEHGDPTVTSTGCEALTGWTEDATDCDDSDGAVYPGAAEVCNNLDDDCDGVVDPATAVDAPTWYRDADNDSYGSATSSRAACDAPAGYLADSSDCDDVDRDVHPGAAESCNGADDDCDGTIDESGTDAPWWYADTDADGFGDPTSGVTACTSPAGYVANDDDCAVSDGTIYPGAAERCNSLDDDCDGAVDTADAVDATSWYEDADADGYGDPTSAQTACDLPAGYAASNTDCNDSAAATYPGAPETCDGADNDCDGSVDESVVLFTWYRDSDSDGYGVSTSTQSSCSQPSGYVSTSTDCNDSSATVYPGASELCNSVDDDCDGTVDDSASNGTWYRDADSDGYGDATSSSSGCTQPAGYVTSSTDCNDASASISPGAAESCNGLDDDCDGVADDGASASTWYRDLDSDGYGDAGTAASGCTAPSGYVATSGDCNDTSASVRPGATETCNSIDDDCDGVVDDGASGSSYWADLDGDGYGDPASPYAGCSPPSGYVTNDDDCDDGASTARPGAVEACDGLDNDCDGTTDDTVVYQDLDGDGFGSDALTADGCPAPADYVDLAGDCDDADSGIHPYAFDDLDDTIDNDCDGAADLSDPEYPETYTASFTDDSYAEVVLTTFEFPNCSSLVDTVYISSNGRLTFGAADTDYTETMADWNRDWAVAGAWDDLNPDLGGIIMWVEQDGALIVRYERIRETGTATLNSFTIVLLESGRMLLEYDAMALTDAISGWSCVPLASGTETNLNTAQAALPSNRWGLGDMTEWSLYEYFTGFADTLDLDNSIIRLCGNVDDVTDSCEQ